MSVYSQNIFSQKEVSLWYNRFKDGWMALKDDTQKHRGRPGTSHTDENCVIVRRFDKGRSKSQSSWNFWSDRYCNKHCSWNRLRFKLMQGICSLGSENAHRVVQKQKNGCFAWKSLLLPRWRRIVCGKHRFGRWNMGLRVYPRVKKKLSDLETSSFTHYKKKFKIEPSAKETMATVF
jgi:hypothetical protein